MSAFRRPQTSIEVFDDPDQRELIRQVRDRLDDLEQVTNLAGFGSKGRSAPLPPRPVLVVTTKPATVPGHFFVEITNPEYAGVNPGNPLRVPIIHQLEASAVADFSSGVKPWPPGVQTTYTITQFGSSKMYFRVRSSLDGKNFTLPIVKGPFQS